MENTTRVRKANKWRDVRRTLSPQRETAIKARVSAELARLPLAEVRKAQDMTQMQLAELMQVNQGAVSKTEQRSDMLLSTLSSYIEAAGGHLDIRAVFPNGEVVIALGDIAEAPSVRHTRSLELAGSDHKIRRR
jgi:DNA-binding XRE family transcriptional regulator